MTITRLLPRRTFIKVFYAPAYCRDISAGASSNDTGGLVFKQDAIVAQVFKCETRFERPMTALTLEEMKPLAKSHGLGQLLWLAEN